jgi:RNA polymerase sigma factor (sigma-70 family)
LALSTAEVERLYRTHARAVLAFLMRGVLAPEVAVDLMAETFAQAYRDRRRCRGSDDAEALAWIFGIARHCLSAYLRRGAAEQRALRRLGVERRALHDYEYDRIEDLAGLDGLAGEIREALAGLDVEQRDALRLRVLEERPYDEVARELGVSEQTARARVSRALRALRASQATPACEGGLGHA